MTTLVWKQIDFGNKIEIINYIRITYFQSDIYVQ